MNTEIFKYPRTRHVSWSEHISNDDKIQHDLSRLIGQDVVVLEKRDGQNYSLYRNYNHARSLESTNHPSMNWVKGLWGDIRYEIPEGWRICGENLYAKHSIHYIDLFTYFEVFSIWDENNVCLSWDKTKEWCNLLGLMTVPVLFEGSLDEYNFDWTKNVLSTTLDLTKQEGYVIRLYDEFAFEDFDKCVVKWVRANHVQTNKHWSTQPIIKNSLKNED